MDDDLICSNSEACLHFITSKFDSYKNILDHDQQTTDQLLISIRDQSCLSINDNENFRLITGYDRNEFIDLLDYFEEEAFKTYEENKTCLFEMFQHLFHLHREFAFDEVLIHERQIAQSFQYRPSLLSNIEKLRLTTQSMIINQEKHHLTFNATPTPKTFLPNSTSFSNRAHIEAFQQKKESIPRIPSPIESNEIDLTKLIRDTYPNNTSEQFKFSKISENWQRQQQTKSIPILPKKPLQRTILCDNALITGANKRFVLLYNMNNINILYIFDMQKDETKEFPWNEGSILSLGHVESNIFYIITSTKICLYDIIKETLNKEYFLYDTLYKDLLLITDDLFYQTALKRHNQIQSIVYDDCCYYLYMNKEYNQILIKCSLDTFQPEINLNLTKKYPQIDCFLGLTMTTKSLMTFLVLQSNTYEVLFCDELHNYNLIQKLPINNSIDSRQIVSTFLSNIPVYSTTKNQTKPIQYGKQFWFILDIKSNCVHCLTHEKYLMKISSSKSTSIQSISIFDNKLLLAYNELSVEIIDLDNYFSSLKL